jgi:pimeloyl-ACP methyl ester carboxylesterase
MSVAAPEIEPLVVPPPRRTVAVPMSDGAVILLRQYGRADGRRLALSHGNGLAIDAYLPFWLPLVEKYDLILFDMRNHGENPPHETTAHRWPRFARDMSEIFTRINAAFGEKPTIGVFHSMSAVAALMQAVNEPAPWSGLVLFDPPLFPPHGHPLQPREQADMEERTRRARRRQGRYDTPEQLATQLRRAPAFSGWVEGAHEIFARSTLKPHAGGWVLRNPRDLEAYVYETNVDPTIWPRLTFVDCPLILIGGDPAHPWATPPAPGCKAIHDELGIDYVMIEDTTHFLQIEKPAACRRALEDFIARLDEPARAFE